MADPAHEALDGIPPARSPVEGYARSTWHHLRLAMVALALGLVATILYENARTNCFQNSISAYWYTPARGYLVALLVGMSLCMVCLRGGNATEDLLLNFAGMFAPVIAFVPTTPEKAPNCMQVAGAVSERPASIANNATALFAVAGVVVVMVALMWRARPPTPRARRWSFVALAIALAALAVFVFLRDVFEEAAHLTAAVAMFGCIIAIAWVNAIHSEPLHRVVNYRNAYWAVAIGMGLAVAGTIVAAALGGWSHLTILIEVILIALFAVLWVLQTIELWHYGVRSAKSR
jgi:hypothetical protein